MSDILASMRVTKTTLVIGGFLLWGGTALAEVHRCPFPERDPISGKKEGGCVEACELASDADEQVSDFFLERLRTISTTGHHVDASLSPTLWQRHNAFWVAPLRLTAENQQAWQQNRRWAGPCTGLVALFYSKVIQDSDMQNAVDLFELRYRTEAEARRVAILLEDAWNWNDHPFVVVPSGRSVVVAEGRNLATDALSRVALHFGTKFGQTRAAPRLPLCAGSGEPKPLLSIRSKEHALLAHALGFSPSGRFAWLEAKTNNGSTVWSLHIQDLVNDRQLTGEVYPVGKGEEGRFCSLHAKQIAERLAEHGIRTGSFTSLAGEKESGDAATLTLRSATEAYVEVVLQGKTKSSVIGKIRQSADRLEALGLLRSPYEARSVAWVVEREAKEGDAKLHVFGGRLDKVDQ